VQMDVDQVTQGVDITGDGGVFKEILVEGKGSDTPPSGADVRGMNAASILQSSSPPLLLVLFVHAKKRHILCHTNQSTTLARCSMAPSSIQAGTRTSHSSSSWVQDRSSRDGTVRWPP